MKLQRMLPLLFCISAVAQVPDVNTLNPKQPQTASPPQAQEAHPRPPVAQRCDYEPHTLTFGLSIDILRCHDAGSQQNENVQSVTVESTHETNDEGKALTRIEYIIDKEENEREAKAENRDPNSHLHEIIAIKFDDASSRISASSTLRDMGDGFVAAQAKIGFNKEQDGQFDHRGQPWLRARQLVVSLKPPVQEGHYPKEIWTFFRIIADTKHDSIYVLVVSMPNGGNQLVFINKWFDSLTVAP